MQKRKVKKRMREDAGGEEKRMDALGNRNNHPIKG
jgi:hypothetical protein